MRFCLKHRRRLRLSALCYVTSKVVSLLNLETFPAAAVSHCTGFTVFCACVCIWFPRHFAGDAIPPKVLFQLLIWAIGKKKNIESFIRRRRFVVQFANCAIFTFWDHVKQIVSIWKHILLRFSSLPSTFTLYNFQTLSQQWTRHRMAAGPQCPWSPLCALSNSQQSAPFASATSARAALQAPFRASTPRRRTSHSPRFRCATTAAKRWSWWAVWRRTRLTDPIHTIWWARRAARRASARLSSTTTQRWPAPSPHWAFSASSGRTLRRASNWERSSRWIHSEVSAAILTSFVRFYIIFNSICLSTLLAGFNHRSQASSIDLNVVRLCFQVFIEGPEKGKFTVQLPPIVSEPIYDKSNWYFSNVFRWLTTLSFFSDTPTEAMAELIITKLSHYAAPCTGGKEIILLCDRVAKDDIQVRFFHETVDCALIWEAYGEFLPNDVHKQVAISLRTPKYYDESIQQPVTIQIQLRRPSDGCTSLSRSFQLTPRELDPDGLVRKRHKRLKEENYDLLQEYIQLASGPSASGQMGGAKRSASVSFTANKTPGSPKKDLVQQLFQQQQQQQQQASTSAAVSSSSRSPFVYGPPQSTPVLAQQSTIVQSNVRSSNAFDFSLYYDIYGWPKNT